MKAALIPPAFNFDMDLVEEFDPPCSQMYVTAHEAKTIKLEKVKRLAEHPWLIVNNNSIYNNITRRIRVDFDMMYYEEIIHTRAFDTRSLIGNIGGSIGMILGFALWQVPDLLTGLLNKAKK